MRARRVGERHEVGEERHLDLRLVEHEPGVPGELRLGVEEDRVEVRHAVEQRGEAEVERSDADPDDVVHGRRHAAAMRGARVQPSSTRVRSGSSRRAISSPPSARQRASIRVLRASGSQTIRDDAELLEQPRHEVADERLRDAAAEQLGRADEQMKAAVAGLRVVQLAQRILGHAVGLDVGERVALVVGDDPLVEVRERGLGEQELAHDADRAAELPPRQHVRLLHPAVDELEVGLEVEVAKRDRGRGAIARPRAAGWRSARRPTARRCRRRARPGRAAACAGWPCTATWRRRAGGRAASRGTLAPRARARSRSSSARRSPSRTRSSATPATPSALTTPSALLRKG